jgi:hypothetical protein
MYLYEKQVHEVAYWRKANAIHNWFITNHSDIDDCKPIELNKQDLYDLRELCIKVLDVHTTDYAEEMLPPASGFFFGSTEIDEWYWQNIKETIDLLNKAIDCSTDDAMFEYQASW